MEDKRDYYIECPRFGGHRVAPCCVHLDKYRRCRRTCKALAKYLEAHPGIEEVLKDFQAREAKKKEEGLVTPALLPSRFSGTRLPNAKLCCKYCQFQGKTQRGLLIHYKRTHKIFMTIQKLEA